MQSNTTKSQESTEPDNDHRLPLDHLREHVEARGVWFETYDPAEEQWISVVVGANRTESSLRQQYGAIRNLTPLVALDDIMEVLDDAC